MEIHHKILDIGDNGLRTEASPVFKFIHYKFGNIHGIKKHRTDHTINDLIRRGHIAGGNGVKLGCQANHGSGFFGMDSKSILGIINIGINSGKMVVDIENTLWINLNICTGFFIKK